MNNLRLKLRQFKTRILITPVALLFLSPILTSCNDLVQNSNSSDALRYAYASLQGGPNFKNIVGTIIQKCAYCHQHQAWYGYDEVDYQTSGLVSFGTGLVNSPLYYRLSNSSVVGPTGARDMPQGGGAALTDTELELLQTWIDGAPGG